jgi:hypothetical protein
MAAIVADTGSCAAAGTDEAPPACLRRASAAPLMDSRVGNRTCCIVVAARWDPRASIIVDISRRFEAVDKQRRISCPNVSMRLSLAAEECRSRPLVGSARRLRGHSRAMSFPRSTMLSSHNSRTNVSLMYSVTIAPARVAASLRPSGLCFFATSARLRA